MGDDELMTPGEVAVMFRVDAKTVGRWRREGRIIPKVWTIGGHSRYSRREMLRLRDGEPRDQ